MSALVRAAHRARPAAGPPDPVIRNETFGAAGPNTHLRACKKRRRRPAADGSEGAGSGSRLDRIGDRPDAKVRRPTM